MNEEQLQILIAGALKYFTTATDCDAEAGAPYLIDGREAELQDFTGIIGISGRYRGAVYFTASRTMLVRVLAAMGESDTGNDNLADLAGEIANTISGNARADFGKDFLIAAPMVVRGSNEKMTLPKGLRSYSVPIVWRGHRAQLVISVV